MDKLARFTLEHHWLLFEGLFHHHIMAAHSIWDSRILSRLDGWEQFFPLWRECIKFVNWRFRASKTTSRVLLHFPYLSAQWTSRRWKVEEGGNIPFFLLLNNTVRANLPERQSDAGDRQWKHCYIYISEQGEQWKMQKNSKKCVYLFDCQLTVNSLNLFQRPQPPIIWEAH